jgi:hypothetical protein
MPIGKRHQFLLTCLEPPLHGFELLQGFELLCDEVVSGAVDAGPLVLVDDQSGF